MAFAAFLLAGALFASNPAVLHMHQFAISEPLFISFLLGALALVLRWLARGQRYLLLLAALTLGMVPVVRYAGLPFADAERSMRTFATGVMAPLRRRSVDRR